MKKKQCLLARKIGFRSSRSPILMIPVDVPWKSLKCYDLRSYMILQLKASPDHPVLVDSYIVGQRVASRCHFRGRKCRIPGIMEHIERAGVHSGDSMAVYPPQTLSQRSTKTIADQTKQAYLAIGLNCGLGMMNIQFVIKG